MKKTAALPRFPYEFKTNISCDDPTKSLLDENDNQELRSIFFCFQTWDILAGLEFAEDTFLTSDIKSFTPEWFEWFILNLHRYVGQTLLALNNNGHPSGIYTQRQTFVRKECNDQGDTFESLNIHAPFSLVNYQLIKEMQGLQAAEDYKSFSELLLIKKTEFENNSAFKKTNKPQDFFALNISLWSLLQSTPELIQHPGYNILLTTFVIGTAPVEVKKTMSQFYRQLHKMIQDEADPAAIAAYALEITKIHPFPDCNGRVARILMNCILMSYGIKPILFEGTMKKKLHYAIQISDKDEQAVARVIRQCIEANNAAYLPSEPEACNVLALTGDTLFIDLGTYTAFLPNTRFDEYWATVAMFHKNSELPTKKVILNHQLNQERERADRQLRALETKRQTAESYCKMASRWSVTNPSVSIFYYFRAANCFNATILSATEKAEALCTCYFNVAKAAVNIHNYDYAFLFASKAYTLLEQIDNPRINHTRNMIKSYLDSLTFVNQLTEITSITKAAEMMSPQKEPDTYLSLKNQGNEAYKHGQYHNALKFYEQALLLKPDEPTLSLNKGLTHFKLGQCDETVKACRTALQFDPQYFKARFYLAKACCELSQYDDALIELSHCLTQKPTDKDCLLLKDQCSRTQRHLPK